MTRSDPHPAARRPTARPRPGLAAVGQRIPRRPPPWSAAGSVALAALLLWPTTPWGPPLGAQTARDSAALRATALDYIEGWYSADADRMQRALHPHLAKRFLERLPDGSIRLTDTSALELVEQVRAGGGAAVPASSRRTDVRILDVFQDVASVRVDAHGWIDYMHLARVDGRWVIVNVLWEIRGEEP